MTNVQQGVMMAMDRMAGRMRELKAKHWEIGANMQESYWVMSRTQARCLAMWVTLQWAPAFAEPVEINLDDCEATNFDGVNIRIAKPIQSQIMDLAASWRSISYGIYLRDPINLIKTVATYEDPFMQQWQLPSPQ